MCTPDNFFMHAKMKKNDAPLPHCLHLEQNGSFQNSLSVAAITKIFLKCSIFLEAIPCLLLQSNLGCPPICSLCFGFPCHFAKLNLIFIAAFQHEQILHIWYLHEVFNSNHYHVQSHCRT